MNNPKQANQNHNTDNEGLDIHWELRIKLSPPVKKLITTAIGVGKVNIAIGKILIPLLLTVSTAVPSVEHFSQPVLPSDSMAKPLPWRIEQS
jgi:hypothetical protein